MKIEITVLFADCTSDSEFVIATTTDLAVSTKRSLLKTAGIQYLGISSRVIEASAA